MATGSKIVLRNTDTTITPNRPMYLLNSIQNLSSDKDAAVIVMPTPESEGESNIITKMGGAEVNYQISFTASDSATDLSNGDNIKTVWQQIIYLWTYFVSGKILNGCELYIGTDGLATIAAKTYDNLVIGTDCQYKATGQVSGGNWSFDGGITSPRISMRFNQGLTF